MEMFIQIIELIKIIIYVVSFTYTIKLIRSKKTKKLSVKLKDLSITTEYYND